MKETKSLPGAQGMTHLSRMALSRLLAGDLDSAELKKTESHLVACPACARAFGEARRHAAAFAESYPTLEHLAGTRRTRRAMTEAPPGWAARLKDFLVGPIGWRPAFATLGVLAVAGAMVWMSQLRHGTVPESVHQSDFTAKGGARFHLFVNGRPASGDTLAVRPGDTLQLGIIGPSAVHYAVFYQDDGGKAQAYFPPGPDAEKLGSPEGENLPNSLILETGWRLEVLHCLASDKPFGRAEAEDAVRIAGSAAEPGGSAAEPGLGIKIQSYLLKNVSP